MRICVHQMDYWEETCSLCDGDKECRVPTADSLTKKGAGKMSERQEKKRRYNQRLEFIARFEQWYDSEPPVILFWRWWKWKNSRPIYVKEEPK